MVPPPINLSKKEKVVASIHKHWIKALTPGMVFLIVATFSAAIALVFLYRFLGTASKLIFFALLVYLVLNLLLRIIQGRADRLFITNRRVASMEIKSLFHKQITEVHYDKIQTVYISVRGVLETLFDVGDITIKTAANDGDIKISFLPHPTEVHSLILNLRRKYANSPIRTKIAKPRTLPKEEKDSVWKEVIKDYIESKIAT